MVNACRGRGRSPDIAEDETAMVRRGETMWSDRLDALGGTMNIASSPGNDIMLWATVPLKAVVSKVFA